MQKKVIICPNCRTTLEITNPKGEDFVLIACPECHAKIRVAFDTGETVIAEANSDKKKIGKLVCGGKSFELKLGMNIIGRESPESTATIKIPTDDRSVSRVHAEIDVVRLENERIKVILRDIRSKEKINAKPICFEDQVIFPEDRIDLENGDTFLIGNTQVKYIQK